MKFSATVRRWRRERALTQRAAAKRLGVPYRTFQDWELGNRTPRGIAQWLILDRLGALEQTTATPKFSRRAFNALLKTRYVSTLAAPITARAKSQEAPTESTAATSPPDSKAPRKTRPAGRTHR